MNLNEKVKQIKAGKLTAVKNVMQFSKKIATPKTKNLNIFLHLNENAISQAKEIDKKIKQKKQTGKLAGLCFAVKSNICVSGLVTNCASKVLENFVAPFNATVINKLLAEDAIILGMVNMDEFASGSSGETSAYGPCKNPLNPELIPGGSSSGSAASVAADLCDFSLGSDTGGSIRNPASHCGIVGLKPTYGSVSRYGLIDMSMSFDQIGPLTKTPEDAELIFNTIKGQDNFDTTTKDKGKLKPQETVGVLGLVSVDKFCDKEIARLIKEKTHELAEQNKLKIKPINLPLDIALETYYIIVYTEFFSATRKFDGRRFGIPIDKFGGPEVIRRIIGGKEISQEEYAGKYYRHALKAKNYIKTQFEKLFKDVDLIILPTVPKTAHKISDSLTVKEMYAYDVFTTLTNIAGVPAISIPAGSIDSKQVGLQIIAPHSHENLIFDVAKKVKND